MASSSSIIVKSLKYTDIRIRCIKIETKRPHHYMPIGYIDDDRFEKHMQDYHDKYDTDIQKAIGIASEEKPPVYTMMDLDEPDDYVPYMYSGGF
jgi:hypothetical protein